MKVLNTPLESASSSSNPVHTCCPFSPWMMAVPVSWQKGSMPFTAVSALRRNCRATYLSFSDASGSVRIFATCSLCARRSMNSQSWKASCASRVSASLLTLRISLPSNSPVLIPSFDTSRYSVSSLPNWNIGAYLNSAIMFCLPVRGSINDPLASLIQLRSGLSVCYMMFLYVFVRYPLPAGRG